MRQAWTRDRLGDLTFALPHSPMQLSHPNHFSDAKARAGSKMNVLLAKQLELEEDPIDSHTISNSD